MQNDDIVHDIAIFTDIMETIVKNRIYEIGFTNRCAAKWNPTNLIDHFTH